MAYRYVPVDRDQPFLLPPDIREWLPESHLVWLVIDVVARVDTSLLHRCHPNDGPGRAAYDPDMMLGVLIYAYCTGVRSSRVIERLCVVDVAFRVLCANRVPDHSTIARFRQGHEAAAQQLFVDVLAVCAAAGLATVGVVAVDGTKIGADAALRANRTREQIEADVAAMFADAAAKDAVEDRLFGDAPGDALPAGLVDRSHRGARLDAALAQVQAEETARRRESEKTAAKAAEAAVKKAEAAHSAAEADAAEVTRRGERLEQVKQAEATRRGAVEAAAAAAGRKLTGPDPDVKKRRSVARAETALAHAQARAARHAQRDTAAPDATAAAGQPATTTEPPPVDSDGDETPKKKPAHAAKANVTDPDSRVMKTQAGWIQGYNSQSAVNDHGVVLAALVTQDHNDLNQAIPVMAATVANLAAAGVTTEPDVMLFDAGYCSENNITADGPNRLIATTKTHKLRRAAATQGPATGEAPPDATPIQAMEHRLLTEDGQRLYAKRQHTVEPVFGHTKANLGYRRFMRRGLQAVDAEWKLIAVAHNITKLHRQTATT